MNNDTPMRFLIISVALSLSFCTAVACRPGGNGDSDSRSSPPPMEARIQQLEDRQEIRQLLMDYGRFLDQRDFASFSQLFAEKNGEWIGGMGKARGRQAIREFMEKEIGGNMEGTAATNFHLFMNDSIDVNGDRADAISKWIFVIRNPEGQPQPFYLGHYEDQFVRENGNWKFLKRVVYTDIPGDDPES